MQAINKCLQIHLLQLQSKLQQSSYTDYLISETKHAISKENIV